MVNVLYFSVAGKIIKINTDLNISHLKLLKSLNSFKTNPTEQYSININHYFSVKDLSTINLGKLIYQHNPWKVYTNNDHWYYHGLSESSPNYESFLFADFSQHYSNGDIYCGPELVTSIHEHGLHSLSLFSTDQIWLVQKLPNWKAALIHSSGVIINGKGFLFVGRSDAGKSTILNLIKNSGNQIIVDRVEYLSDDRNIIRKEDGIWNIYGTWFNSYDSPVSPSYAPLQAFIFLDKDKVNEINPIVDKSLVWRKLLPTLIRGVNTQDWWNQELTILEQLIVDVPCYSMKFDRSGDIVAKLLELL